MTDNRPTPLPARDDHYSYAAYADPRMAETFDAARFSGPIGRLLAETQEQVIAGFLAPLAGSTVLDVGTGTGRAAIALAQRGAIVTGLDASAEMLAVARRRALEADQAVTFLQGDAHALEVPDQSFDSVVCLRVLMHTPDWRRSLAELCRVARASRGAGLSGAVERRGGPVDVAADCPLARGTGRGLSRVQPPGDC